MDGTNLEDLRNWRNKTNQRTEVEVALETLLFVVIEILAVGGNVMVITAVWRSKSLRTITHHYITVLSTADLFVALFNFPMCIACSITGTWLYGELLCRIQGTSFLVWGAFTMIIVSITAINRYFCVVKPNLYKKLFTRNSTIIIVVSTLLICTALLIGVPTGLSATYQFGPHLFCIPIFPTKVLQMIILLPVFFFFIVIPMLTIFICYFKVIRRVRQHVNKVAPSLSRQKAENLKARVEEIKINKVVFTVLIVFFLLWTPVCIIGVLFLVEVFIPRCVHLLYDYLIMTSAATNPIVYGFLNQAFRSEYAKTLGCKKILERGRNRLFVLEFSASRQSPIQLSSLRNRRSCPMNTVSQTT